MEGRIPPPPPPQSAFTIHRVRTRAPPARQQQQQQQPLAPPPLPPPPPPLAPSPPNASPANLNLFGGSPSPSQSTLVEQLFRQLTPSVLVDLMQRLKGVSNEYVFFILLFDYYYCTHTFELTSIYLHCVLCVQNAIVDWGVHHR